MAWKYAWNSKEEGGLGIINVRTQNSALLLKFSHKFHKKAYLPWVHLTWQHFYKIDKPQGQANHPDSRNKGKHAKFKKERQPYI